MFLSVRGQTAIKSSVKKDSLNKFEIEAMYGHYIQNGNNSAVTGGRGTEKLTVYSPAFKFKKTDLTGRQVTLKTGVDIISSASTDNIDYIVSSASILDARTYANLTFTSVQKKQKQWWAGSGFSIESDYFSLPFNAGVSLQSKNKMRQVSFEIFYYKDDLRWGRIDQKHYKPQKLIYPSELRYKQWYNTYKRNSYNLKTGIQQVINKRTRIGIFPELAIQEGLLATPFHRVYFRDSTLRVENLPSQRIKSILGLKFNRFTGGRTILKCAVDLYADNFGIMAIGIEQETAIKLNYAWTLSPFIRLYQQQGSRYFAPYGAHAPDEIFYTSDYDLSDFKTIKAGLGIRHAPYSAWGKRGTFNEWQLRYSYYRRSNGLYAHIMNLTINCQFIKADKKFRP